ncbi:MAG: hypothetical protein VB948_11015, partial [Pseudomonadales bacterium]
MDLYQWELDLDAMTDTQRTRGSLELLSDGEAFFDRLVEEIADAREQLLETDLLGASASSRSPSFCLLAAHIKWQIGARVKNKPPKREFARTWQLFLRQAESRST